MDCWEAGRESGKVVPQSPPFNVPKEDEGSQNLQRHLEGEAVGGLKTGARGGWVSLRENIQNEKRKGLKMKH